MRYADGLVDTVRRDDDIRHSNERSRLVLNALIVGEGDGLGAPENGFECRVGGSRTRDAERIVGVGVVLAEVTEITRTHYVCTFELLFTPGDNLLLVGHLANDFEQRVNDNILGAEGNRYSLVRIIYGSVLAVDSSGSNY